MATFLAGKGQASFDSWSLSARVNSMGDDSKAPVTGRAEGRRRSAAAGQGGRLSHAPRPASPGAGGMGPGVAGSTRGFMAPAPGLRARPQGSRRQPRGWRDEPPGSRRQPQGCGLGPRVHGANPRVERPTLGLARRGTALGA